MTSEYLGQDHAAPSQILNTSQFHSKFGLTSYVLSPALFFARFETSADLV